jgi:hypothetical protein
MMLRPTVLLVIACVSAVAAAAPQRTFVASTGNDSNSCTLTDPCRGFQTAINAVTPAVKWSSSTPQATVRWSQISPVIVPPGVHAGLSPIAGIRCPDFPANRRSC